ncbi:hypothetical protein SAM23877_6637 [Streptomyces ambofaciens ATCC 23877]|uniref:Uncharacterized protein n=1 Tax=Streptomyces ambofaciens (strain ATCC 23877 / 3486 / DSM 40053 / JCM 4204 / NBRC 12836 / NRRL B-2516) TaxID=278992 RepID=A0ADU0_STRA7|nr:hypothetical protein [Streptomyces ambofaciens]AKZ59682.1 hypothetical protein SAM23877_6637 [Streptomyces ambofaciens ATCC 23877]CAJ88647.1 conserved hypothetical protein [Streptomyces ambofaciens ATCC 23877]
MRTVYSGELHVAHGRFHVDSRPTRDAPGTTPACAGQANGLCGAAVPGHLLLVTGLHTGRVGLTVEVHGAAPPLDDGWEDVVEASFRPASASTVVLPPGDGPLCALDLLPTDHRVRYCGRGMDRVREEERAVREDGPPVDHYLLQFWPAPPAPDLVVRQTSHSAAHRHRHARGLPPPPRPEDRSAAELRRRAQWSAGERPAREHAEALSWGGRLPSRRLREAGGDARGLASLDRELVDAVDTVCPATQRDLARWAARRALSVAGLDGIDWIESALAALDRGEPLPDPFDDPRHAWDRFFADDRVFGPAADAPDGCRGDLLRQAMAMPALLAAAGPDPLSAALDALFAAAVTHGTDCPALFAQVRRRFPALDRGTPGP